VAKFFTLQSSLRVDRDKRRINGVAIASKGNANGDVIDDETLQRLATLGNAGRIRARFDHPNRSDPGEVEQTLDNLLGHHENFRIEGDVCRADSQMAGVNVDKEDKILAFAEKNPDLFGISIVFDEEPPPKGQKPKKGAPCRPVMLYAGDFVDLPAANAAGLFSTKANQGANMEPLDVYAKDGKFYAMCEGKEYELKHSQEAIAALQDDDDDDDKEKEEAEKKKQGLRLANETTITAADVEKAAKDAVTSERAYRKMFGTIIQTAGLKDKAADDFETTFYGRAEADLKFLAQHAIGSRATALGEGNGHKEQPEKEKQDAETELTTYCTKKFSTDASMRRRYRVNTTDTEAAEYKAGFSRFMAVEKKCRADEKKAPKREAEEEEPQDDRISGLLKKATVAV